MRRIFTIGETVLDIIFKNLKVYKAVPGGSMLNAAVSMGRLHLPVHFISEYANDETGMMIDNFLSANKVNSDFIYHYTDGKTPLALAFLDQNSNASYSFYKLYPKDRLAQQFPAPSNEDIILFGSLYSISPETRVRIIQFIKKAKNNGSLIIYDPNIRQKPGEMSKEEISAVLENISLSTLIRASNEDCEAIFGVTNGKDSFKHIKSAGCSGLVYTTGGKDVKFFSETVAGNYAVPFIEPVSTIGAGDNFNAGIISFLFRKNLYAADISSLTQSTWNELVALATSFSADVCMSYYNYISLKFSRQLRTKIN